MQTVQNWRTRYQRYALAGEVCPHCDKHIFPPRDVCPYCHHSAGPVHVMKGSGEIYSCTQLHHPPAGFEDQAPYTVALVQLDEGPMLTAQLTDVEWEEVSIGMRVEMVTRKLREEGDQGQVLYGYKFRPVWP